MRGPTVRPSFVLHRNVFSAAGRRRGHIGPALRCPDRPPLRPPASAPEDPDRQRRHLHPECLVGVPFSLTIYPPSGDTPLHVACYGGRLDVVKALLPITPSAVLTMVRLPGPSNHFTGKRLLGDAPPCRLYGRKIRGAGGPSAATAGHPRQRPGDGRAHT